MHSKFARKIKARQPIIGVWMQIPHPMVAETLAQSGADFVLLDGEHAPVPVDALVGLLPAIERHGMPVLYRVRTCTTESIKGAFDAGVSAVMVPMIGSLADAEAAVAAAKYPPLGRRGFGPWRGSNYYQQDMAYLAKANADAALILQIETRGAVEALDQIAALPGVAALFAGPFDLCLTHGLEPGKLHPELIAIYERMSKAAKKHGIALGIDVGSPAQIPTYRELGFSILTHGLDTQFLLDGSRHVTKTFHAAFEG